MRSNSFEAFGAILQIAFPGQRSCRLVAQAQAQAQATCRSMTSSRRFRRKLASTTAGNTLSSEISSRTSRGASCNWQLTRCVCLWRCDPEGEQAEQQFSCIDLQDVHTGTAEETLKIFERQQQSVSCPTWREDAPARTHRIFVLVVDSAGNTILGGKMMRRMFRAVKLATSAVFVQPCLLHQYSLSTLGSLQFSMRGNSVARARGNTLWGSLQFRVRGGHLALPRRFIAALPVVSANRWQTTSRGRCLAESYKRNGDP